MPEEHKLDEFIPGATISSRGKKLVAGLIDAALSIAIVVFVFILYPSNFSVSVLMNLKLEPIILIVFILLRIISIVFLNGTPGMHLLQIRLLNSEEEPASAKEKFFAAVFVMINGVDYYNKKPK